MTQRDEHGVGTTMNRFTPLVFLGESTFDLT